MIVTLAGHVDHGKTTLVKSLTGTDTDRLKEEKARGLTIDLGFAYTNIGNDRIGFVDVPGHHRFIHNMVAGIAEQQHALLVIAADDGIMPQTREHFQILQLMGLSSGTIALTKIDRVEPQLVDTRESEIRRFVQDSFLETAPILRISAEKDIGIDNVKAALQTAAQRQITTTSEKSFRLCIDRSFSVRGAGTVVTGTVLSGRVQIDNNLSIGSNGELNESVVRVRGIHVRDMKSDSATTGDRASLNLVGVPSEHIQRGDWLLTEETLSSSNTATIELKVVENFPRTIRHWLPIHLYHYASHAQAHISLLESKTILPGTTQLVALISSDNLLTKLGDRVIVRDHHLGQTIGGGLVVNTTAPASRRRNVSRLAVLQKTAQAVHKNAIKESLYIQATEQPIPINDFLSSWNIPRDYKKTFFEDSSIAERRSYAVTHEFLTKSGTQVTSTLDGHHKTHPESQGLELESLAALNNTDRISIEIACDYLIEQNVISLRNGKYSSSQHKVAIPKALENLYKEIEPLLNVQQPPSLGDIAKLKNRALKQMERDFRGLASLRFLIQISPNRFFLPTKIAEMAQIALDLCEDGHSFNVREFRDASGIGRNVVIEILEYFDAKKFTKRTDNQRQVVGSAELVLA